MSYDVDMTACIQLENYQSGNGFTEVPLALALVACLWKRVYWAKVLLYG